jgi:DNA-3-methyladenine glycosylase I
VAAYKEKDFNRLMNDAGIIRNRLKINAAIENAKTILGLQKNSSHLKTGWTSIIPKQKMSGQNCSNKLFVLPAGNCK